VVRGVQSSWDSWEFSGQKLKTIIGKSIKYWDLACLGFSDLNGTYVGQSGFLRTAIYVVCSLPTPIWRRWYRRSFYLSAVVRKWVWVYIKTVDVPITEFRLCWIQKLASLKSDCYAIRSKYPEAATVVQQVYKILSDIEILSGCTRSKLRESSECASIVKSAEENRKTFVKV
jgi:hypothetical protein